jgi:hypothetical protein
MLKNKRNIFTMIAVTLLLHVHAQSYSPQQIELAERLDSLVNNAAPEIAYIQTSKDIYETGEDLWFKVYLLNAQYLVPSLLSKTLYLQLLNENSREIVWQEKYEIQNGFSDGRVYLQSTLPEGDYFLAAYTPNSFFNDSSEFKALKRIKVVNDIGVGPAPGNTNKSGISQKPEEKIKIQFTTFPEGGNLVSGIKSKLAFKAVNTLGEPVDIMGTLYADSLPVLKFSSSHHGMGTFNFVPLSGKKYLIKLTQPTVDSSFFLPKIYDSGMVLQLIGRDNDVLSFKVSQSSDLSTDIYLRVQCRGIVYGMTSVTLSRDIKIIVPLTGLPQGIAEVTLFNDKLIPIAERLVYVNRNQKLNISAELSKGIYQTRGKAILKISVKDENGDPVIANLGISAFDRVYQNPLDSNNILTHYFLSTQLKGRIYNPSYYFNSDNKNREEQLDLLMLTQGWRKYIWNEENLGKITTQEKQVIFDGIKGIMSYTDRKKKIPKEQTFVMAFSPNKDSTNVLISADSVGMFEVLPREFKKWENDYVYLKPFGAHPTQIFKMNDPLATTEFSLIIKMDDPFQTINKLLLINKITYPISISEIDNLETPDQTIQNSGAIRIKEVTIKGQRGKTNRGKFLGTLDSLAYLKTKDDYVCRYGVLNCPRHDRNEPGTIRPSQGKDYVVILSYNTPGEHTRRVTYYYPKYSENDLLRVNNLYRVKAYYGTREFYKPDYDKETGDAMVPDFRNTLLWEPSVFTDENGEATLSFFCSDINTDFVGRIEGVGGDGLLGTGFFKFTVRKLKLNP